MSDYFRPKPVGCIFTFKNESGYTESYFSDDPDPKVQERIATLWGLHQKS